jgi:hypothetical protein
MQDKVNERMSIDSIMGYSRRDEVHSMEEILCKYFFY